MVDFAQLLQQGSQVWLFIPSAIVLGALHGLEPGHSKTLMAAFIVAVRGTPAQAVLLGLSAALSHSLVVWLVALSGLYFGSSWDVETQTGLFAQLSGLIIIAVAVWMIWRTWRSQKPTRHEHAKHHGHDHSHAHDHNHHHHHSHHHSHDQADGHAVSMAYQDAHAQAHARDIQRRFGHGSATNGQIILFGLSGGLLPCPASITVLLLCLQAKRIALGVTLVASFSAGLALTLVASGVVAAVSLRKLRHRWTGLEHWMGRAPYLSAGLMLLVGAWMIYRA